MLSLKLINKPHPFIYNWKSIAIPGLVTFLVIILFAPLGYNRLDIEFRILLGFTNGLIASLSVWGVVNLFRSIFPLFMQEEKWTLGKEFILILSVLFVIISSIFLIFIIFDLSNQPYGELFFNIVIKTVLIGTIPIFILIAVEQNAHQRKKLKQALELTRKLRSNAAYDKNTEHKLILEAENGKVEIILQPEDLYYLKSDGNYVEVYYHSGSDKIEKKLIRNRLKTLEAKLPEGIFFHCHKSYIVSVNKIVRIEGNARNLELILKNTPESIPVSRQKKKELEDLIQSA